jgi:hypothetical protein
MKAYLHHLRTERTPHERRRIAMQAAAVITGFMFFVWLSTLGMRLAQTNVASTPNMNNAAATLVPVEQNAQNQ